MRDINAKPLPQEREPFPPVAEARPTVHVLTRQRGPTDLSLTTGDVGAVPRNPHDAAMPMRGPRWMRNPADSADIEGAQPRLKLPLQERHARKLAQAEERAQALEEGRRAAAEVRLPQSTVASLLAGMARVDRDSCGIVSAFDARKALRVGLGADAAATAERALAGFTDNVGNIKYRELHDALARVAVPDPEPAPRAADEAPRPAPQAAREAIQASIDGIGHWEQEPRTASRDFFLLISRHALMCCCTQGDAEAAAVTAPAQAEAHEDAGRQGDDGGAGVRRHASCVPMCSGMSGMSRCRLCQCGRVSPTPPCSLAPSQGPWAAWWSGRRATRTAGWGRRAASAAVASGCLKGPTLGPSGRSWPTTPAGGVSRERRRGSSGLRRLTVSAAEQRLWHRCALHLCLVAHAIAIDLLTSSEDTDTTFTHRLAVPQSPRRSARVSRRPAQRRRRTPPAP